MNEFLGLPFGPVRPDACGPNSLNQAKLVTAIAAMLTLGTTCADAAKRQVGNAPRVAAQGVKVVPIRAAPEPSYWMYRRCSPGARAADPYTVLARHSGGYALLMEAPPEDRLKKS